MRLLGPVRPRENNHLDWLGAPTDLHGASLELLGRYVCGLGRCHTHDHLARGSSGCQSRRDVDGVTERSEVIHRRPKPCRPNKCLAGVDGRSYWYRHRRRGTGPCRSLGQVDCGRYRYCRVAGAR
jgi:hypothetical protein